MNRLNRGYFSLFLLIISLVSTFGSGNRLASAYEAQWTAFSDERVGQEQVKSQLKSPALFIENVGQFPEKARYQVRGGHHAVWLADNAIWVTLLEPKEVWTQVDRLISEVSGSFSDRNDIKESTWQGVNIRLSFIGANDEPQLEGFNPLTTTVSFFKGSQPDEWRADVPVYGGVRYIELYPGLDLELGHLNNAVQARLVCRVVNCRAALASLKLQVEGAEGLALEDGQLVLNTSLGEFTLPLFVVIDGEGNPLSLLEQEPTINDNIVTMPFATQSLESDHRQTDTPDDDPTDLLYSTYLGGNAGDQVYGITVDGAGNVYATGWTASADFPTTPGAFDTNFGGVADAFVTKLNATGSTLIYSTFLGGSDFDLVYGGSIEIDSAGNAFIAGSTDSDDFPTTSGAFDTTFNGMRDGFVTKLNATGSALVYSTFLGSSGFDAIYGDIAVDGVGNAYVIGSTNSADFPTTSGAFDTTFNGVRDGFVTKLNAAGSTLLYSTFLGGSDLDTIYGGIDVQDNGNAYVTGTTYSVDFPTTAGAFDTTYNGNGDVFVAKLNAAGSGLVYSTLLGGTERDFVNGGGGIAVDTTGIAHVAGSTDSADFPTTPGAFDTSFNGSTDAYVTKLNSTGSALVYSTFLGGSALDSIFGGITVDSAGNMYVTGLTDSIDFPITPYAYDTSFNGNQDAFVTKLDITGGALVYSTFLGGTNGESGGGSITVDSMGNTYVAGYTTAVDFPTTPGAFDTSYNGNFDGFVTKLLTAIAAGFSAMPTEGARPLPVQFINESTGDFDTCAWDFGDGTGSSNDCDDPAYTYTMTGTYSVSLTINGPAGVDSITQSNLVSVFEPGLANFTGSPLSGVAPLTVTFENLSSGVFDTCLWDFGDGVGTSSDCGTPVYTYMTPGMFSVTLTVDGPGGGDFLTRPNFITANMPAAAEFVGTPTVGIAPLVVTFNNLSTGDYSTCFWTFGDGGTSSSCQAPSHQYASGGNYTVSLSISGAGGNSAITKSNYITAYNQVAAGFSANPLSGTAPLSVLFTNLSTGDYDSCYWEYGDGNSDEQCGQHQHVYETNGRYTVALTVSGLGGMDTIEQPDLISVFSSNFETYLPIIFNLALAFSE
jgi:PKD repeat protein